MPDQLALGVSGRWTCPRCGLPRGGARWEIREPDVLTAAAVDLRGEDILGRAARPVPGAVRVVCALCARDYPNGRRRQCSP